MVRRVITVIICSCLVILASCSGNKSSELKVSGVVVNELSDKHINIPGTQLYIIPPKGFTIATNMTGLTDGKKDNPTSIQIIDIPGGNFYKNAAEFSREAFELKGAKVFDYQELYINGFPAKYIHMQGEQSLKAHCFTFGDNTFSTSIMAGYPASDEKISNELKDALFSIVYDKNLEVDMMASAPFSLDNNVSKFKYANGSTAAYCFSVDGIDKGRNENEPFIIVSPVPKPEKASLELISDIGLNSIIQNGLTDTQIKSRESKTINGYNACETIAEGILKGDKSLIYYLVVVENEKALLIVGTINSDFEENLSEFRKIAYTVKFK